MEPSSQKPTSSELPPRTLEEKLQRVSAHLEERLSQAPWYREQAERDPKFWRKLATAMPNLDV